MASVVTKFSDFIRNGKLDDAAAIISTWPVVLSSDVQVFSAEKCKLLGAVLHISRGKKVHVASKTVGDKKSKRQVVYHRLLFVRLLLRLTKLFRRLCFPVYSEPDLLINIVNCSVETFFVMRLRCRRL